METMFLQIVMAVIGSIGFAIFFNVRHSKILTIAIGGLMSWLIYLVCFDVSHHLFFSNFYSALVVYIYCEVMARVLKAPANVFLIPSIVPLLPGGSLYYTMSAFLVMDVETVKLKGLETLGVTLGIVMGVVIGSFFVSEFLKFRQRRRMRKLS